MNIHEQLIRSLRGLSACAVAGMIWSASPAMAQEAAAAPQGEPQISEIHTVEGGDTLWDLCTKYLNSPWYWPKIWSYNPQITNPHWIYPGNELRFYPSDESLPTAVAVSRDLNAPLPEEMEIPDELDVEDLVKQVAPVAVSRVPRNSVLRMHQGFVTKGQQAVAGEITNSPMESQMLADFDRIYVKLKSAAKKGESYAVYRQVKEISHPVSGEEVGYVVEVVGTLTIVDTSPVVATGQIQQAYRPIQRGDFVGPWPETAGRRVLPAQNEADLKGYIVETMEEAQSEVGEHHMVFIDKGRNDGVKLGNTFVVYARGDSFTRDVTGLPNEIVGRLMVIDVQEGSSTAMILRSMRELSVGDKIEMRRAI